MKSLTTLDLRRNKIRLAGVLYLINAAQRNTVILIFDLFLTNDVVLFNIDTYENIYKRPPIR